jgi:hypothetical protein
LSIVPVNLDQFSGQAATRLIHSSALEKGNFSRVRPIDVDFPSAALS